MTNNSTAPAVITDACRSSTAPAKRAVGRDLLKVFAYNSVIALLLATATGHGFRVNFIYSQAIGLSIAVMVGLSFRLRGRDKPGMGDALLAIPAGLAVGFCLGTWGNGLTLTEVIRAYPQALVMSAVAAVIFGLIATFYFSNWLRMKEVEVLARDERLRRTEQESLATQAELKVLQAQIEPHFLFNTLATVIERIDADPAVARAMLIDLTGLLRASLANTRRESIALGEELDLLRAYLGIMAARMGPRLRFSVDADVDLLAVQLPPLLLQPLVENAIRHGLEPKAEGGALSVRCTANAGRLHVVVEDSGRGPGAAAAGGGVGLANIRQRLAGRYGGDASLELSTNTAGGMSASLDLPLQTN